MYSVRHLDASLLFAPDCGMHSREGCVIFVCDSTAEVWSLHRWRFRGSEFSDGSAGVAERLFPVCCVLAAHRTRTLLRLSRTRKLRIAPHMTAMRRRRDANDGFDSALLPRTRPRSPGAYVVLGVAGHRAALLPLLQSVRGLPRRVPHTLLSMSRAGKRWAPSRRPAPAPPPAR